MAQPLPWKDDVLVLTFDLYGTVVDMQEGLVRAATPYLAQKGWGGRPEALVTWWRRTHFENSMIDALIPGGHTPYREIGRRALDYVLARALIPHDRAEVERLVAAIERLEPFADAPAALTRLQRRYRLAILSNGDPDMLENARPHIGFPFELLLSAAEAGAFKPHAATYRMAAARLGVEIGRVLHVANHAFDCIGAKAAGMRTAFVNRRRRPYEDTPHQPDLIVDSLAELAEILA
ncbi:MAG TPA: haloacid dehalogenase type II [Stellaceae bacterium]|nr:haloacid dehalogenase type II [Stellaceae bacterium]